MWGVGEIGNSWMAAIGWREVVREKEVSTGVMGRGSCVHW